MNIIDGHTFSTKRRLAEELEKYDEDVPSEIEELPSLKYMNVQVLAFVLANLDKIEKGTVKFNPGLTKVIGGIQNMKKKKKKEKIKLDFKLQVLRYYRIYKQFEENL